MATPRPRGIVLWLGGVGWARSGHLAVSGRPLRAHLGSTWLFAPHYTPPAKRPSGRGVATVWPRSGRGMVTPRWKLVAGGAGFWCRGRCQCMNRRVAREFGPPSSMGARAVRVHSRVDADRAFKHVTDPPRDVITGVASLRVDGVPMATPSSPHRCLDGRHKGGLRCASTCAAAMQGWPPPGGRRRVHNGSLRSP